MKRTCERGTQQEQEYVCVCLCDSIICRCLSIKRSYLYLSPLRSLALPLSVALPSHVFFSLLFNSVSFNSNDWANDWPFHRTRRSVKWYGKVWLIFDSHKIFQCDNKINNNVGHSVWCVVFLAMDFVNARVWPLTNDRENEFSKDWHSDGIEKTLIWGIRLKWNWFWWSCYCGRHRQVFIMRAKVIKMKEKNHTHKEIEKAQKWISANRMFVNYQHLAID